MRVQTGRNCRDTQVIQVMYSLLSILYLKLSDHVDRAAYFNNGSLLITIIGGLGFLYDVLSVCVNHRENNKYPKCDHFYVGAQRSCLFLYEIRIIFSCLSYCIITILKHFLGQCYKLGIGPTM